MSLSRVVLGVLVSVAVLAPAVPADATATVLCSGYTSCTDKGYSNGGYYAHRSTSYWQMYTGTNCTNYAAYRLVTTNGMPNVRPKSSVGNARDWGFAMASITNATPAAGAIAWWGRTGHHVAYVERVVSPTEILVSESNWSGAFDWRRIVKSGSGWPDGFIHFSDLVIKNTAVPAIVGAVKVGSTLKATTGTWSPADNTYLYQWLSDGSAIEGATAGTFSPTPVEVGKALTVRVSATRPNYPGASATSRPTVVAPGTLTPTTPPAITGAARVDDPLTATTGAWSPTGSTYTYQWFVGGAPRAANGPTYTPAAGDYGLPVTVTVTASRSGYTTTTATAGATGPVARGTFAVASRPTVSGAVRVGSRLTASTGGWSPAGTYSFQWYASGQRLAGATRSTFTPSPSQLGDNLRVRVTARRDGYTTAGSSSADTVPVAAGHIAVVTAPTITGTRRLGSVMSVAPGTYRPSRVSLRYQWMRDGKAVAGATGRTRKVASADLAHKLSVRVTVSALGYARLKVTTAGVWPRR